MNTPPDDQANPESSDSQRHETLQELEQSIEEKITEILNEPLKYKGYTWHKDGSGAVTMTLEQYILVVQDAIKTLITQEYERGRRDELNRIIDLGGIKRFQYWTKTDIANYFVEVGRRLQELEKGKPE